MLFHAMSLSCAKRLHVSTPPFWCGSMQLDAELDKLLFLLEICDDAFLIAAFPTGCFWTTERGCIRRGADILAEPISFGVSGSSAG
jgi:hypothetical protein